MGAGATMALFFLGAMREILGNGTLFDGANLLLGEWAKYYVLKLFILIRLFLLAILPPGAFIGLGLMLAGKYLIDERMIKYISQKQQHPVVKSTSFPNKII